MLIIDYGFNLSATKEISINRNNFKTFSKIFCSVFVIKFSLFILSSIIFIFLIFLVPRFNNELLVFAFAYISVFGNLLFPTWFFQGMEKMKYITITNVLVKLIFIVPIFLFVQTESDYFLVPLINSLGILVSGIIGFLFAVKLFKIKLTFPRQKEIIYQFKEGWHFFISTIFISTYTISTIIILGFFATNTVVGYYYASEQIIKAVKSLINPISQAAYPKINKLFSESKKSALIFLKHLSILIIIFTSICSIILFIFAENIILIAFGPAYFNSIIILKILSFLPFIIGLSTIFGVLGLLTFNKKEIFSKIVMFGGILNLILSLILVPIFGGIGTAVSWVLIEFLISILCIYKFNKFYNILKV